MSTVQFDFGMIGLGVMGRNLLLNMADHGFTVVGFDLDKVKTAALESAAAAGTTVKGVPTLEELVLSLQSPRKMMLLVPAGKPVDVVLTGLIPLLSPGDVVIDGGNSHYIDTLRRLKEMQAKGIHFMGIGISGGEMGARSGPSIMPGGDPEAYKNVQPILEAVAAKVNGRPCVAYLGKGAAGHYVKMVHNGIEYALMQLISETYWLLKHGMGLNNDQLHSVYSKWNEGEMQSFLLEITSDIFLQPDEKTGSGLVDMILDKAGSKGTGKWTSQDAMDLSVPVPVIDMAVSMRDLSALKDQRVLAASLYKSEASPLIQSKIFVDQLHDALHFATIIAYAQGLAMLQTASEILDMDIPVSEVVRVWQGGCIIRSALLNNFLNAFEKNKLLPNILLDSDVAFLLKSKEKQLRDVIQLAIPTALPVSGLMAALSYFDGYKSAQLPTNLIQAQRDYFGAHTYQRIDLPGIFHTEWNSYG